MFFASDNGAAAHPKILEALAQVNSGYRAAYGADPEMDQVRRYIQDIFEAPNASIYLVATGTAANALSLACITQPWQTVFCHRVAHVEEDECGAPEFFTGGAKLTLIEGEHAKMQPDALQHAINRTARAGVHNVQHGALSITQATENGTVYTLDEIQTLTEIAKQAGMKTHLDGARFANALVALGCSAAEMTWKSGIDIVSFGGTKNGCLGVEAVVIFDPDLAWQFELRRKRAGHLFSKHRYLSAQMAAYLKDGLWLELATHANQMAAELETAFHGANTVSFDHPREANMLFASFPRAAHGRAAEAGAYYYHWPMDQSLEGDPDAHISCRLVCSWQTTTQDIKDLSTAIAAPP